MQNSLWTLLLGFVTGVVTILVLVFFKLKNMHGEKTGKRRAKKLSQNEFDFLIQQVTQNLSQVCQKHDDLHLAYQVLGNLYRLQGDPQRSLVIHQNLLSENKVPKSMRDKLELDVADDLIHLGAEDKAFAYLKSVNERSPLYLPAKEKMLKVFVDRGDYEQAYETMKGILKRKRSWRNRKRAAYFLALIAEKYFQQSDLVSAKKNIKEALYHDKQCVLALLLKGRIALEEKNHGDAIDSFVGAIRENPGYAFMFCPLIEDAYYQKQSFMRMGDTFEKLVEEYPDNAYLKYSLAKFYRKRKMYKEARRLLEQSLAQDLPHVMIYEELLQLNKDENRAEDSLEDFTTLIEEIRASYKYECSYCNKQYESLQWFCEDCGRIETIVEQPVSIKDTDEVIDVESKRAAGRL